MLSRDADADLRRMIGDRGFGHRDAARRALRFRRAGDVADLVAIADDPHPCALVDVVFALAGTQRTWLNWVPMPSETTCAMADEFAGRRISARIALTQPEPPSAVAACRRVLGPIPMEVLAFPRPDIRTPVRRGRYAVWRYDGIHPVPSVPAPSAESITALHEVAGVPWASPLSGFAQAERLGKLPLSDLLGLLAHLPGPPPTPRWQHLARRTPTYWYRLLQPWVCLGILHHQAEAAWETSVRRTVLIDLAFGAEDWVSDAALFALVTAAYREPARRPEVRDLVRERLDAAVGAPRLVTIEESLAALMLITPGCRTADRRVALRALGERPRRRWWPF